MVAPLVLAPAAMMAVVPVRFLTEYGVAPAALGVLAAITWSILWGAVYGTAGDGGWRSG